MNHSFKTLRLVIVSVVLFCAASLSSALAEEVIKSFDAKVQVAKDGTYTVTETITVNSEGRKIRRGIFRDFPLLFEDADGKEKQVGFHLISTLRNGKPDKNRLKESSSSVRIYIGDKDVFIGNGEHTYTIKY